MTPEPLLARPPAVVNLGLEVFAAELLAAGVDVVHVDWRPPAGGDARLVALLDVLEDEEDEGNGRAAPG